MVGYSLENTDRKPYMSEAQEYSSSGVTGLESLDGDNLGVNSEVESSFVGSIAGKVSLLASLTNYDVEKASFAEIAGIDNLLKAIQNEMLNGFTKREQDLFNQTDASKDFNAIKAKYGVLLNDFDFVATFIYTKVDLIASSRTSIENFDKYEKLLTEANETVNRMTPVQRRLFESSGKFDVLVLAEQKLELLKIERGTDMLKVNVVDILVNRVDIKRLNMDNEEQVDVTIAALKEYGLLSEKQKEMFKKTDYEKRGLIPQKLWIAGAKLSKLVTVVINKINIDQLTNNDKAKIDFLMKIKEGLDGTEFELNTTTKKILENAQASIRNLSKPDAKTANNIYYEIPKARGRGQR